MLTREERAKLKLGLQRLQWIHEGRVKAGTKSSDLSEQIRACETEEMFESAHKVQRLEPQKNNVIFFPPR